MDSREELIGYLAANKSRLKQRYHLTKIGVFGSMARADHTDSSDIDLIVEFEDDVQDLFDLKYEIRQEIGKRFNRQVDICREKYVHKHFRDQILSEAVYV